ncbi:MAG: hypothetical protein Q9202_006545 [Teloschistes flavicans]
MQPSRALLCGKGLSIQPIKLLVSGGTSQWWQILRFLGTAEVISVPLYLAAGPSLDVWTSDRRSQEWLQAHLLHGDKNGTLWPERPGEQSEHGILLGVDSEHHAPTDAGLAITEILLYAASSGQCLHLTPPASSSPNHVHGLDGSKRSIGLYALPLSSNIFQTINQSPIAQDPNSIASEDGCYLPRSAEPPTVQSRKRPKIETLFNDASQNRRAHKKRGGEGVAKAMAGLDGRIPMPLPSPALLDSTQPTRKPAQKRAILSRASTTGSLTHPPPTEKPLSRPQASGRPTLPNTHHRSSLSLAESALSPSLLATNSPVPDPSATATETLNKTALSRIIMAGMRMYGLQQPRRKSLATPSLLEPTPAPSASGGEQDEYKAIYHQTFKAAAFVFRKSWREKAVGQEGLRDVVDLFLGRFCGDPFAAEEAGLEGALNAEFGI